MDDPYFDAQFFGTKLAKETFRKLFNEWFKEEMDKLRVEVQCNRTYDATTKVRVTLFFDKEQLDSDSDGFQ